MTKSDRKEFRQFCQQATDQQLRNIVLKEREAKRPAYARIAEAVAAARGL